MKLWMNTGVKHRASRMNRESRNYLWPSRLVMWQRMFIQQGNKSVPYLIAEVRCRKTYEETAASNAGCCVWLAGPYMMNQLWILSPLRGLNILVMRICCIKLQI